MFCDSCCLFWSEAVAKARIPKEIKKPRDIIWTLCESTLHNSIRELKQASDLRCRICRLIYTFSKESEQVALFKDQDGLLRIVLLIGSWAGWGPFTLLHVEFRGAASPHLVLLRRVLASCHGILTAEGGIAVWPGEPGSCHHSADELTQLLDKAVGLDNDHTGSDGALQLASYWIKSCIGTHSKCNRITSEDMRSFMPTRLLDVANDTVKLVDSERVVLDADRRYIALSHCWGPVPIIRTLRSNYEKHREHIPPEQLSKTFTDAIHATRKLGFRYIWIDSMCIIQDDDSDWATEAATMCDVYQNATVTIAAAHAPGGDVGCFMARDGLMNLPFHIDLPVSKGADSIRGLHFRPNERPREAEPVLYTRAWVLQEQVLSSRMLIFDGHQLKWECLTMHGSEACPTDSKTRHDLDMSNIRGNLMNASRRLDSDTKPENPQLWTRMKQSHWCELVMQYTHRRMTKSDDRLVALAGIAQALGRETINEYLAGLWRQHFFLGLLWALPHHVSSHMNPTANFDIERDKPIRHETSIAPTWSWAAVTAPVSYDQDEIRNADCSCEVLDVTVSEGVKKQTGRATIRGHVRRGYVNAVYPYLMHEAATQLPHMTAPPPVGLYGVKTMSFKKRRFHPNDHFLFSQQRPAAQDAAGTDQLTTDGPFRFVRGAFRPDEIIKPTQEITFIAIAQRHTSEQLISQMTSTEDHDPVKVQTLALVPAGNGEGTYRRVGHAVWKDCAWYGYLCGWKDVDIGSDKDARERPVQNPDWGEEYRPACWDDLEFYRYNERVGGDDQEGRWVHEHEYTRDQLPHLDMYQPGMQVGEETIVIV